MDINVLLTLLTLSEKLQGHPRLSGMKTLVDEQINKMQIDSDEEVKRLYADRKAYQDKIAADQPKTDAEARVLAEQNVNPGTGPRAIPASPAIEPVSAPYVPQTESPLIDTPVSPSTTTNGTSTGRRI